MGARPWTAEALARSSAYRRPTSFASARPRDPRHLEERPDGSFALTSLGQSLKPGSPSRLGEKVMIVVEQYWQPWADLVSSLQTGAPAFDHVFGTDVWAWRNENFRGGDIFAASLAARPSPRPARSWRRWISPDQPASPTSAAVTAGCLPDPSRIPSCEASFRPAPDHYRRQEISEVTWRVRARNPRRRRLSRPDSGLG